MEEVAYIGDDLNDFEILKSVGLSAAPGDAISLVKSSVNYFCSLDGGKGAFREFADVILFYKNE